MSKDKVRAVVNDNVVLAVGNMQNKYYYLSGPHLHSEDDDGSGGIGELLIDADSPVSRVDHKGLLVVVGSNILEPCSTLIPENKFSLSQ